MNAQLILGYLKGVAATYGTLAQIHHLVLVAVLIGLWRRSISNLILTKYFGLLALSVSALAMLNGNVFNGTVFALLSVVLILERGIKPAGRAPGGHVALGALTALVGFWYPHFVDYTSVLMLKAPFGLVPCPTLMVITGLATLSGLRLSLRAERVLALVALFYGITGVLSLSVYVDLPLLAMGIVMVAHLFVDRNHRHGLTTSE